MTRESVNGSRVLLLRGKRGKFSLLSRAAPLFSGGWIWWIDATVTLWH